MSAENVERTDDGVRICWGFHERATGCEWEYFTRAAPSVESRGGERDYIVRGIKLCERIADVAVTPGLTRRQQIELHRIKGELADVVRGLDCVVITTARPALAPAVEEALRELVTAVTTERDFDPALAKAQRALLAQVPEGASGFRAMTFGPSWKEQATGKAGWVCPDCLKPYVETHNCAARPAPTAHPNDCTCYHCHRGIPAPGSKEEHEA